MTLDPSQAGDLALAAAIAAFFEQHYRPQGTRMQLLLGFPARQIAVDAAEAAVLAQGLLPARRVAHLRPRPSETVLREADVLEYLDHYGHEYSAALFTSTSELDMARVSAAAAAVGCTVAWEIDGSLKVI